MTTEEFAAMIIEALDEQNYFKKGTKHHPQDIAYSFTTVGETVGLAMNWAISREHEVTKNGKIKRGLNEPTNLAKSLTLPIDDEISPVTDNTLGYNESKQPS